VPLVPEIDPPEEIFGLPNHKLIGLTIQAKHLHENQIEKDEHSLDL
jgi:regulator of PEP synthase PpsR (kinase-PPPase family)